MAALRIARRLRSFARRLRSFARRDSFEQFWVIPVWLGLGLSSLVIATVPFRQIAPRLGTRFGTSKPHFAVSKADEHRALQIGRTIRFAVRYAPWRADCYPQAIVARLLLGYYRLPYTLSLGLRREAAGAAMQAHAWVECGEVCVSGGFGDERYSLVGVFASRPAG